MANNHILPTLSLSRQNKTIIMLASVTLKRSLQQISNAKPAARVCGRSLSQAAALWEPAIDTTNVDEDASNNGIIRFTMKPKPQQQQQHSTSNRDYDPLLDRTAAAEQMSKQMEDSYYYASFRAKEV